MLGSDDVLTPGVQLDRYELLSLRARGGMGEVWLGRLMGKFGFERLFAIKTIKRIVAMQQGAREMFMDEARIISRIQSDHVVPIVDLGESNGVLYMAMEWVAGDPLTAMKRLAREKKVPWQVVVRIGLDACAGLQAAHEAIGADGDILNVVHRDVSPHNILVTETGLSKVIDFGIAKARERLAPASEVGNVKGKLRYMSPEQVRADVGPWTDVFGLGATMYELLTGATPFNAATVAETLGLLLMPEEALPLPQNIPIALRDAIAQSLVKDPALRFQSMRAFRQALDGVVIESGERVDHDLVRVFFANELADVVAGRRRFVDDALRARPRSDLHRSVPPVASSSPMIVSHAPRGSTISEVPTANVLRPSGSSSLPSERVVPPPSVRQQPASSRPLLLGLGVLVSVVAASAGLIAFAHRTPPVASTGATVVGTNVTGAGTSVATFGTQALAMGSASPRAQAVILRMPQCATQISRLQDCADRGYIRRSHANDVRDGIVEAVNRMISSGAHDGLIEANLEQTCRVDSVPSECGGQLPEVATLPPARAPLASALPLVPAPQTVPRPLASPHPRPPSASSTPSTDDTERQPTAPRPYADGDPLAPRPAPPRHEEHVNPVAGF